VRAGLRRCGEIADERKVAQPGGVEAGHAQCDQPTDRRASNAKQVGTEDVPLPVRRRTHDLDLADRNAALDLKFIHVPAPHILRV
jgi:hypothetical protein